MLDLLIENGRIVDGSGNPWYPGSVAIQGTRIAAMGSLPGAKAREVIDAGGMVICPGFIDVDTHAEGALLSEPALEPSVRQGITTVVVGQDGFAYAPVSAEQRSAIRWRLATMGNTSSNDWIWATVAEFLARLEGRVGVNVLTLVPLGNLYVMVAGWKYRPLSQDHVHKIKRLAAQAMDEGAAGLSIGLFYPPQHCVTTENLVEVCKVVRRYGGFCAMTPRYGLGDGFLDPRREAIQIGEQAGIPVHLSHVSLRKEDSGRASALFWLFDGARHRGIDLTIESYCYPPGADSLMALMPASFFEGGPEAALRRLQTPRKRQELVQYLNFGPSFFRQGLSWDDVVIAAVSLPENKHLEGKSIGALCDEMGKDPGTVTCDLLLAERLKVGQKYIYGLERDVRDIMRYPAHMVASDSVFGGSSPHPRVYGNHARYLGYYTRELGILRLEDAVRKMTSFPAQRVGINDRGLLRPGLAADVVVLDPARVADRATWEDPCQHPAGIEHVVVNGQVAVRNGKHTGHLAGQVIRH